MKKILALVLALVTLLSCVSCFGGKVYEAAPADFSADGMNITLTKAFKKAKIDGYTAAFDSKAVAVFLLCLVIWLTCPSGNMPSCSARQTLPKIPTLSRPRKVFCSLSTPSIIPLKSRPISILPLSIRATMRSGWCSLPALRQIMRSTDPICFSGQRASISIDYILKTPATALRWPFCIFSGITSILSFFHKLEGNGGQKSLKNYVEGYCNLSKYMLY